MGLKAAKRSACYLKQCELPEEAASLSVVLTVQYFCKKRSKTSKGKEGMRKKKAEEQSLLQCTNIDFISFPKTRFKKLTKKKAIQNQMHLLFPFWGFPVFQ